MEVIIKGSPEEIAALVQATQERRTETKAIELMIGDKSLSSILKNQN